MTAAAQASPSQKATPEPPLENLLSKLSKAEQQAFLLKLVGERLM
ncbi:MAG: hypothetical protein ACFB5Z_00405 [Elainellaceae cyanobacterium]